MACCGECDGVIRSHMGPHYGKPEAALCGQINPTTLQHAGFIQKPFIKAFFHTVESASGNCVEEK